MKKTLFTLLTLALSMPSFAQSYTSFQPLQQKADKEKFVLFLESRDKPIQFNDSLRTTWLEPQREISLKASRGETYVYQIALCALKDVQDVQVKFSSLSCGKSRIAPECMTCYNLEGIDFMGHEMKKEVSVEANHLQPLWIGVDMKDAEKNAVYEGKITVKAGGEKHVLPLRIETDGKEVENGGYNEAWRLSRLNWLNSTIGEDGHVTEGYLPVQRDGQNIHILGRSVTLAPNGLPASVESFFTESNQSIASTSSPILSGKGMQFIVETEGGEEVLKHSPIDFEQESESALHWSLTSLSPQVKLQTKATMEFDGFMRYEITLKARKDCQLKDIRLETPFTPEKSQYMMGLGREGGLRPHDFQWKWNVKNNQDMLWVGNVNGGMRLKWMDENYVRPLVNVYYHYGELKEPKSWSNDGKGGVSLSENNSGTLLKTYSGARSMKKGEELHFIFEVLITPFHAMKKEITWGDRYFHGGGLNNTKAQQAVDMGANIVNIHHATDSYPFINYPYQDQYLQEMKDLVEDAHKKNTRMKFYYTTRELTKNLPEFWALYSLNGEVIFPGPGRKCTTVINPDGPGKWLLDNVQEKYIPAWRCVVPDGIFKGELDLSLITTPDSRLNNFYMAGLDFMVQKLQLDGIYIDDSALDRITMRRARKVIDAHRPAGRIDFHTWNHLCESAGNASCLNIYMDLLPYTDLCWVGEGRDYNHAPDKWLIEVAGIPYGLTGQMLQNGGHPWRGMVYGITNRGGYGGHPTSIIWQFWDKYRIQDTEMFGYWDSRCPLKTDNPDVKATLFKGEHQSIIAIASWNNSDTEVNLTVDKSQLNIKHVSQPAIKDFQEEKTDVDLSQPIRIPNGKGFLFVVEN